MPIHSGKNRLFFSSDFICFFVRALFRLTSTAFRFLRHLHFQVAIQRGDHLASIHRRVLGTIFHNRFKYLLGSQAVSAKIGFDGAVFHEPDVRHYSEQLAARRFGVQLSGNQVVQCSP